MAQRVIVKESFVDSRWNHPAYWYGKVSDRIPKEAGLHRLVPRHQHIVEYLGYQVYKPLKMIRLYTAFAELGDLRETAFSKYNHSQRRRSRLRPHVPTIAILYFFEAMAAGVCLMAHGQLPLDDGTWPADGSEGDAPSDPWAHNIVHQDIKDGNYFLSRSNGSATWPGLPVLKLGVSVQMGRASNLERAANSMNRILAMRSTYQSLETRLTPETEEHPF